MFDYSPRSMGTQFGLSAHETKDNSGRPTTHLKELGKFSFHEWGGSSVPIGVVKEGKGRV